MGERAREPVQRAISLECEMRSILVVFCFPPLQLSSEIFLIPEMPSSIELLSVCLGDPLYLPVHLWASGICGTQARLFPLIIRRFGLHILGAAWVQNSAHIRLKSVLKGGRATESTGLWRKRVGVEPTIRLAKSRINGFEGHEDHRAPFASNFARFTDYAT